MNKDAKIVLYGGGAISTATYLLGAVANFYVGVTGVALIGCTLFLAAVLDNLETLEESA